MPISFEIAGEHRDKYPPFSDGCPKCVFDGTLVPHATITNGNSLIAFYHHGRCGHEWSTSWGAQWDHTWVRAVGGRRIESAARPALPASREAA